MECEVCSFFITTMHYGVQSVFFLCNNNALWSAVCSFCVTTMHYEVRGVFFMWNNYALWRAGCIVPV